MKALDIAFKDITQSFRSMIALAFMFGMPLLVTGMFVFLFGGTGNEEGEAAFELPVTQVQVVNLDTGQFALGETLVEILQAEGFSDLLAVTVADDVAAARNAVDAQQAGVAIIIPADFSDAMIGPGMQTKIELYQDPTLSLGPSIVSAIVTQFADNFSGSKIALGISMDQLTAAGLVLGEDEVNAIVADYVAAVTAVNGEAGLLQVESATGEEQEAFTVVGLITPIMAAMSIFYAFFTGASTMQSILREEERGTLPRLFTTPTPYRTILQGKFIASALTVFIQMSVLLGFGAWVFKFNWGNVPLLLAVILGITAAASGLGVCVISFAKNMRQSGQVLGLGITLTGMIGMISVFTMTAPDTNTGLNAFALLVPQGWAMQALQRNMAGASAGSVLTMVAGMLVWSLVLFWIGNYRFDRRYV